VAVCIFRGISLIKLEHKPLKENMPEKSRSERNIQPKEAKEPEDRSLPILPFPTLSCHYR